MEILKVVIADDEVRICQLIQALIDWDSLGMAVVGLAHNGEEACQMVKDTQPDILITDIRMPGCSGLELVKTVKELDSSLELGGDLYLINGNMIKLQDAGIFAGFGKGKDTGEEVLELEKK